MFKQLPYGYEVRQLSSEEFVPLWEQYASTIFDEESLIFRLYGALSNEEKAKADSLRGRMGTPYQLSLGLYYEGKFVGWSAGHQECAETYYMRNSAILPEHRRKGLYTALLSRKLEILTEMGFQRIYSRHSTTNNNVIIPKLKAGFQITTIEVNDIFGVLVNLTYYPKELRRKILKFRVGDAKPDEEIRKHLKF